MAGRIAVVLQLVVNYYALSSGNIILFFISSYVANIINSTSIMCRRAMGPDIWDYQQWLSGKRLEVSAGVFGLIFTPFNTMIAMTIPAVYAVMGFTSDWDVLYNDAFRNKIFLVSIAIVLASTILSIIPFLFYDLTEEKHRKIIEDLKQRAEDMDTAEENDALNTTAVDQSQTTEL